MAVEVGIWRIDSGVTRLLPSPLEKESELEDALAGEIGLLNLDLLLIGRQVSTSDGKRVDLLAIDSLGQLHVIELKRDRTPRDAVAQLLDYGSWAQSLSHEEVVAIHRAHDPSLPFEEAFATRFGVSPPESLNDTHQLVLVASALDPSSERIIHYTARWGVPINVVFFRHFRDGDRRYIARTWLIDPPTAAAFADTPTRAKEEPWNGHDFGVTLGEGPHRTWGDCRRYGFVSGGQGLWYSRTLAQLFVGARVFVAIPSKGYVGVGVVTDRSMPVTQFTVMVDGEQRSILDLPLEAPQMGEHADDPNLAEYLVRIEWVTTVPSTEAYWEPGMRANQNTAFKLRSAFTLDRLTLRFGLSE